MSSRPSAFRRTYQILALALSVPQLLSLSIALREKGWAKEPSLSAILLYDTEKGASYEQVNDLLINGKTELRGCTAGQRIDKSSYGKLPKLTLTGATSLERTADGVLILSKDSTRACVVPANVSCTGEP